MATGTTGQPLGIATLGYWVQWVAVPNAYWRNLVLSNLEYTMQTITTLNGYKSEVGSKVARWPVVPTPEELKAVKASTDFPYVLIVDGAEEDEHRSGQRLYRRMDVQIIGMIHDNSTPSTTLNNLHGDIVKVLLQDIYRGTDSDSKKVAMGTWINGVEGLEDFRPPHAAFNLAITVRSDRADTDL